MAFVDFAKLDSNGLVLDVTVLDSESIKKDGVVDEDLGIQKCAQLTGHPTWKMFDKDMLGDVHLKGGTKLRKNSASIGGTYDSSRDAFIPIKPYASWVTLNEDTCQWEAPVEKLDDGKQYEWNEIKKSWDERTPGTEEWT